ncbi:Threonine/homoserine/homoserine lactone efflux protein [Muriicola jejuensis]|uniref:LysE family transporter n=1 Tax=Muriicola jejuensis TaxID=504488 RepID=A0A6P0UBU8_9FLAO|nr:LysE family translocator [Muriicola jejuensis]NER10725.1 LysE family transporter [Muriicola jejuensis]SMP16584.1 Threonine/homoserine/homoserine lactone efflux protein [Muriicola jejuensis]
MNYEILWAFSLATATLAIFPGPDNIYVLTQSIVHGKKYGLATTAGLISGCLVHTTLLAFGVSAIISLNPLLFYSIKIFGALYLFYLAYRVLRAPAGLDLEMTQTPRKSLMQLYKQGFIMNVLNPKVTIFFLAFFPGFLFSDFMNTTLQFYVLGILFMVISFAIFGLIALLAGSISGYLQSHRGAPVFLKWLQVLVFTGIGLYLLLSYK